MVYSNLQPTWRPLFGYNTFAAPRPQPPAPFPFQPQASFSGALPESEARLSPSPPDRFLDPHYNLSSGQALSWFSVGFILLALGPELLKFMGAHQLFKTQPYQRIQQQHQALINALRQSWQKTKSPTVEKMKKRLEELFPGLKEFFSPSRKVSAAQPTQKTPESTKQKFDSSTLDAKKMDGQEITVYQNYNDPLSSVYRLIQFDPRQGGALLVYIATSVLGYITGSLMQGAREAWVRQQESKIRSQLIEQLQEAVRESIRIKIASDNQRREKTRMRIYHLLQTAGVAQAAALIQDFPVPESPITAQHYFYEPTHRKITFRGQLQSQPLSMDFNVSPAMPTDGQSDHPELAWQKSFIALAGSVSGFLTRKFIQLLADSREGDPETARAKLQEGIMLKDRESWAMIGVKNNRNFLMMSGFFAMSASAALGKTFLDGLREVEVTRLNARTELAYQRHNWLTQDPLFHNIAEEETVNDQLNQLVMDLPCLRFDRNALQKRIQVILNNIGRNSAPPYYPMTPTVGLVEART